MSHTAGGGKTAGAGAVGTRNGTSVVVRTVTKVRRRRRWIGGHTQALPNARVLVGREGRGEASTEVVKGSTRRRRSTRGRIEGDRVGRRVVQHKVLAGIEVERAAGRPGTRGWE
jgi:hypothetical protein